MSSLSDLPTELTTDILTTAILQHPNPGYILAVNRCFNDIGQFIIYTSLRFKSESQLIKFALKRRFRPHHCRRHAHHHKHHHHHRRRKSEVQETSGDFAVAVSAAFPGGPAVVSGDGALETVVEKLLPHFPRSISIRIPGGQGGGIVFEGIRLVFEFCAEAAGSSVLALDSLEFCLNSHTGDPAPWRIGDALSLVNPRKFIWTGPDPPHHFSTAIVPYATYHLFSSMKSWSNLQSLTLTNISFPSSNAFVPVGLSEAHLVFCILVNTDEVFSPLQSLTSLRNVYIGQATLVPMRSLVTFALARPRTRPPTYSVNGRDVLRFERDTEQGNTGLRGIRLVDAYKESIWQERIRRKDLETIAMDLASSDNPVDPCYHAPTGGIDPEAVLGRIREIVSCEALTERIMGGDRAEGVTTLI